MTMNLKERFINTTAMRYAEWFSDKEAFIFPPKDPLDAALRKAKADIKSEQVRKRSEKVKEAISSGGNVVEALKEMREETIKDAKIQETVGFQFKDW